MAMLKVHHLTGRDRPEWAAVVVGTIAVLKALANLLSRTAYIERVLAARR